MDLTFMLLFKKKYGNKVRITLNARNYSLITYFPYGVENFGYGKKNQTFLLHFEKKILGMEKKIKHFCYISKTKFWVRKKNFF